MLRAGREMQRIICILELLLLLWIGGMIGLGNVCILKDLNNKNIENALLLFTV